MNTEVTRSFVARLADVFEADPSMVQPDFQIAERWDSVAVLATIALIDEQFGVTVPSDELTRCTSVAEVLALVGRSVDQRSSGR